MKYRGLELLTNSGIADTETLGLERVAGIHEFAYYDIDTKSLHNMFLTPHLVTGTAKAGQEYTALASSYKDKHVLHKFSNWGRAIKQYQKTTGSDASWIIGNSKTIFPYLRTGYTQEFLDKRKAELAAQGLNDVQIRVVQAEDFFTQLDTITQGKTVWFANAPFDAKQLGALLGSLPEHIQEAYKTGFESWGLSPDMYVTGVNVNAARAQALVSGDWTGVWKAYLANRPKAGERAVRDIQDVVRAQNTYAMQLGMTKIKNPYAATSVDLASRLYGLTENNVDMRKHILTRAEQHMASTDASIHQQYMLEKALKYTSVLQEVSENTTQGQIWARQAERGYGPLAEIQRYYTALDVLNPDLETNNVVKRLARSATNIENLGASWETVAQTISTLTQFTHDGDYEVPIAQPIRHPFATIEDVSNYLKTSGRYSKTSVDAALGGAGVKEVKNLIESNLDTLLNIESLPHKNPIPVIASVGLAAGIFGMLTARGRDNINKNIVMPDYQTWEDNQNPIELQDRYQHQGIVAKARPYNTDFGSPYKGPEVTNLVLLTNDQVRKRNTWLNEQYGARDYETNLNMWAKSEAVSSGYTLLAGGKDIQFGDTRAKTLDITNYNIEFDDADTFVLKRGGIAGKLASLAGFNRGYQFRVAGIDAPEVPHGSKEGQPHGEASTEIFRNLLAHGKNVQLVYRPEDTTYGRSVGTLIIDGKNLSYELVKRGAAGALSFSKHGESLIDIEKTRAIEAQAIEAHRGMWNEPFFQTLRTLDPKQNVPFNRYVDSSKYIQSMDYIGAINLANQAQDRGIAYTNVAPMDVQGTGYSEDYVRPGSMDYGSYGMDLMNYSRINDITRGNQTHDRDENSLNNQYNLNYDNYNNSNSIYSWRASQYTDAKRRRAQMAYGQRRALAQLKASPINHTYMRN